MVDRYEEYADLRRGELRPWQLRYVDYESYERAWCRRDMRYAIWYRESEGVWRVSVTPLHDGGVYDGGLVLGIRGLLRALIRWASDPLV